MIHISYLEFSGNEIQDLRKFNYWLSWMPELIKEKILGYRRWQDALNCLAGNVLLLNIFKEKYGIADVLTYIRYNEYGRPFIGLDRAYDFNISHSGELVLCGVSEVGRVGIDVEKIKDVCIDDFKSQMLDAELQRIKGSNNEQDSFFKYWVEKEAVIKGNGKGLSLNLKSFFVSENYTAVDGDEWYLHPLHIHPAYIAIFASNKPLYTSSILLKKADFFCA